MCVCVCVCVCVCERACIAQDAVLSGRAFVFSIHTDGWMDGWMDGRTDRERENVIN